MIDLHLHTTASDGRATPAELVRALGAAGIVVAAVTDHDTTAAIAEVTARAAPRGIRVIPGIEITAVADGEDVHVLGYGIDAAHPALAAFLDDQRRDRRRRLEEMAARLAALGVPVNMAPVLAADRDGKALGRPHLAAALLDAGHVASIAEAFDRYLASGRPAFVARRGATPGEVVGLVHSAGGVVSLAHPGKLRSDALLGPLAAAGLDALEVFHPDHDTGAVARYAARADALGLGHTGGSDYHGGASGRVNALGRVSLPQRAFATLAARWSRIFGVAP